MLLADAQLFPLLDEAGGRMLRRLRHHPHAPRYNHQIGERLSADGLANIRAFARDLRERPTPWNSQNPPAWLPDFVARIRRDVPFYRRPAYAADFPALPILQRDDLRIHAAEFVPDSMPLNDLIVYTTSGTTGASLELPAHPVLPNRYLPLFQHALAAHGVTLQGGPDRVSIIQICAQDKTVTNCTVMSYLNGAGFAKINLHPNDWQNPNDPVSFLNDCNAEIYTGDPFSFHALMQLPLKVKPKALLSSATALSPGLRQQLHSHFACPVIDIYSMNESGPVAFSSPANPAHHQIFPHNIYIEILDENFQPCPPNQRGQIVLTGGLNPCLPLLRYATGDYAALHDSASVPSLHQFEGRPPVTFRATDGRAFNSVDVSTTLHPFALSFLQLHQNADGSLILETNAEDSLQPPVIAALKKLFGSAQTITWKKTATSVRARKPVTYSSDIPSHVKA